MREDRKSGSFKRWDKDERRYDNEHEMRYIGSEPIEFYRHRERDSRRDYEKSWKIDDNNHQFEKESKDRSKYYKKHFSPNFKKSYKMMSHHEDSRHQMSADPKNKVNLIQVFVNKPNIESNSNPIHHETSIKKQFSPQPQIQAPMPPAPAVNINTPPQNVAMPPLHYPVGKQQPPPPQQQHNHPIPYVPMQAAGLHHHDNMHIHNHPHYIPEHPMAHQGFHSHFHVPPYPRGMVQPYHPPPPHVFYEHPQPWWFKNKHFRENWNMRPYPNVAPSTGYPEKVNTFLCIKYSTKLITPKK
jgi:hypothetical protein